MKSSLSIIPSRNGNLHTNKMFHVTRKPKQKPCPPPQPVISTTLKRDLTLCTGCQVNCVRGAQVKILGGNWHTLPHEQGKEFPRIVLMDEGGIPYLREQYRTDPVILKEEADMWEHLINENLGRSISPPIDRCR